LIDAELKDVKVRLFRRYDALETGKLGLDDLAPRIRELKSRQDELTTTRIQVEAEMVVRGVEEADVSIVKSYANDLRSLLEESDFTERKAFLRSFVKRVEVDENEITVHYKLPSPPEGKSKERVLVLPIDTFGGAGVTSSFLFLTTRVSETIHNL